MSTALKKYVNEPHFWNAFTEMVQDEIEMQRRRLEQSDNTIDVYRAQGEIKSLRRMLLLRDKYNNG
jgi:hypothetical protein